MVHYRSGLYLFWGILAIFFVCGGMLIGHAHAEAIRTIHTVVVALGGN